VDKVAPDQADIIGGMIALLGVLIIMYCAPIVDQYHYPEGSQTASF